MIYNIDIRNVDSCTFPKYRTILADPPWKYNDQRKTRKDGKTPTRGIGACHHYDLLSEKELMGLGGIVKSIAHERCQLFLWATCPRLDTAMRVLEAWGFKYSTIAFVWVKLNPGRAILPVAKLLQSLADLRLLGFLAWLSFFGPGYFTASNVELVLLGNRKKEGTDRSCKPYRHAKGKKERQVVFWPRMGHSQKPDEIQRRIDLMYPMAIPKIELFARRPLDGWDVLGNELERYVT